LETVLTVSDFKLKRVFSLRQEFSNTFHRLLHSPVSEAVPLELADKHFPIFVQGKKLSVAHAYVVLDINRDAFRDEDGNLPSSYALTLSVFRNGSTHLTSFSRDLNFGDLPVATLDNARFSDLNPSTGPTTISFTVEDAGDFAPDSPLPSDISALDESKLQDLYLFLEYGIASGG